MLVFRYFIDVYLDSVMVFGFNSDVSKDIFNFWKEFISIMLEENRMFNFLLKNYQFINCDEGNYFMYKLDYLNEETVLYCYKFFEDVLIACDMELEWKARRPFKNFKTLIETDIYDMELYGLTISFDDIKNYFNYEDDFWEYIESRICFLDSHDEENDSFYGVNMKFDNDNKLENIKIFVPKIINLDTALINVHEIKHAYDLYKLIGKEVNLDYSYYEKMASDSERGFKEQYLVKKFIK